MSRSLKIVLITGDGRRHAWAALRLAEAVDLRGVFCETKPAVLTDSIADEDSRVQAAHFAERDRVEAELLGPVLIPSTLDTRRGAHGTANAPEVLGWIQSCEPDYVVLYGSSLIGSAILDAFPARVVNVHLGLSPYYRGTATNFWPLFHGEPESVGTTIHLATNKIDGGPILAQVRPEPFASDGVHELGTKALMAGINALPNILDGYSRGRISPTEQTIHGGRLCRRREFNAEAVRVVHRRLAAGMLRDFISNRDVRVRSKPIVEATDSSVIGNNALA